MFARPRPRKTALPIFSQKRKTIHSVEEINFNLDDRAEYLTGFHKRKVLRTKKAQEEAAKREREERISTRKQLREERRQELEEHVQAVNSLLKEVQDVTTNATSDIADDDDGWNGIEEDPIIEPIDHEAEYIDEDRYTTVTVEEVDISKEGLHKRIGPDESEGEEEKSNQDAVINGKEDGSKEKKRVWPKKTKKKFRYESKAERKVARVKQKTGNKRRADARKGND